MYFCNGWNSFPPGLFLSLALRGSSNYFFKSSHLISPTRLPMSLNVSLVRMQEYIDAPARAGRLNRFGASSENSSSITCRHKSILCFISIIVRLMTSRILNQKHAHGAGLHFDCEHNPSLFRGGKRKPVVCCYFSK